MSWKLPKIRMLWKKGAIGDLSMLGVLSMNMIRPIVRLARFGSAKYRPVSPHSVIFTVTTRCNMACRHCGDDVWGDPRNDLSLEEIARFSAEMGTLESVALGGGEPFLRKDLVEICSLFAVNNQTTAISIPSNGLAPDDICLKVREILAACPEVDLIIMLSLDGFQGTHDAIRTEGSFVKVMEAGRKLKSMEAEFPRLSLSFNATISNANWKELPALAEFVRDTFQTRLEFNVITGNPRDSDMAIPGRRELEETIEGLQCGGKRTLLRRLYNKAYRDILVNSNFASRQVIPCRAGSIVCQIDANGDVRACPMMPPFGNLRTASFGEIWHGQEALKQFRSISNGDCYCNNDCFTRISLMYYWKLPLLMLKKILKTQ